MPNGNYPVVIRECKDKMDALLSKMTELEDRVDRVVVDMYYGRDKDNPPVTVRLDRLEQVVTDIKALKWAVIVAVITMVADIVGTHLKLF